MIVASRSHEFCYGHRVVGHEGKCKNLHGHNAKVTFTIESKFDANGLDEVGRVLDFSVIKDKLCQWIEENWDHKFLMWNKDPIYHTLISISNSLPTPEFMLGIVLVPFNPTAENISKYLLDEIGPKMLAGLPVRLVNIEFFETTKCSVFVGLD